VRTAAFLVVLLLLPAAEAANPSPLAVALPHGFSVSRGVMLAGHLDLPSAAVANAQLLEARDAAFESGTLTVCPVVAAEGSLRAALQALAGLTTQCPQGEMYKDARVRFGAGTDLATNGTSPVLALPAAALASFAADGTGGLVLSQDGLRLARPGDLFRFVPTSRGAQVTVTTERGTHMYNGTTHAFLHDGAAVRWHAAAAAGDWGRTLHVLLRPADGQAMSEALQPFRLLDVEGALLGADAREPRGNVSGLLYEYGSVAAFVNGAVVGRLAGSADGIGLDAAVVSLVRGDGFDLQADGRQWQGTFHARFVVAGDAASIAGGPALGPPWLLTLLFWVGAVVVMVVRRATPLRGRRAQGVWFVALPLALLVVDQLVLARPLGTSALQAWNAQARPGEVSALAVFEALTVVLAWACLALPVRIIIGRLTPAKWLWAAEAAWALVWLLGIALLPAAFFALGHGVARI